MLYSEEVDEQLGGGSRQGADQEAEDAADQQGWVLDHDGDDHDAVDHLMTTRIG